MGSTSREVVFVLKTQMDQSINAGFSEVAQKARTTQQEMNKQIKEAAKETAKVSKEAAKESAQFWKEYSTRKRQLDKEDAAWQNDCYKKAVAANKQLLKQQENDAKQASDNIRKAVLQRIKDEEKAAKQSIQAQRKYEATERRAFMQEIRMDKFAERAVGQFARVGKSALMLSGTSEENLEKMMRNLIKIQLLYETIIGAKEGIELLQRSWRAYAYSVKLAAEAHAALAVAQAAGGGVNAAGAAGAIGGGNLLGRGLGLGMRGLAALGGGSVMMGGAMVAAPLLAGAAAYKIGTMGPEAEAEVNRHKVESLEASYVAKKKAEEIGANKQNSIEQLKRQYASDSYTYKQGLFERSMSRDQKLRDLKNPSLSSLMSGWSASLDEKGRREPGVAGYTKVEDYIAKDRRTGEGFISQREVEAAKAAEAVAAARKAQEEAEAAAANQRGIASRAQGQFAGAFNAAEGNRNRWVTGTNWIHRTGSWTASWWRQNQKTEQQRLEDKSKSTQEFATGESQKAGKLDEVARGAAQVTEDTLKNQQELLEKLSVEKEAQAQRDIRNAEEYIGKLKEMHEAHLRNADAIERAGRALVVQLALSKPDERRRLTQAMEHSQAGTATDRELALLAQNASAEKAEGFEKQIEARHPEYGNIREFLGKGTTAVDAEKAKAAEEEKRIKETEGYLDKARQAAAKSADEMTNRLAVVLKEMFDMQTKRFTEALEKIKTDIEAKDRSQKPISE